MRKRLRLPSWMGPALSFTIVVALFGLAAWFPFYARSAKSSDLEGAVERNGVARVTGVIYPRTTKAILNPPVIVNLRLGSADITAQSYSPPKPGINVAIKYRVGKSGQVYVDRIEGDRN